MNRSLKPSLIRSLVLVLVLSTAIPAFATPPFLERLFRSSKRQGRAPTTCVDPAVEELAANVDWLEHNIDSWGSIVAKSPDIWGEARLTKYRQEVEETLAKQRDQFTVTLAGASSTRDVALLAASLQMAAGAGAMNERGFGDQIKIDVINEPNIPELPERSDFGLIGGSGLFAADKLQLEPVVRLDQHRRYLDYLNELRRTNEGDDATDAPGYAINLVRIPVSILPGSHSTHGYGAELTATATMQLDENLLPNTFRDLVINDLVDQLSLPMTRFLNSDPIKVAQLLATFDVGENQQHFVDEFNQSAGLFPLVFQDAVLFHAIKERLMQQQLWNTTKVLRFDESEASLRIVLPISVYDLEQLESDLRLYNSHVLPLLDTVERILSLPICTDPVAVPEECLNNLKMDDDSCERLLQNQRELQKYGLRYDPCTRKIIPLDCLDGKTAGTVIDGARMNSRISPSISPVYEDSAFGSKLQLRSAPSDMLAQRIDSLTPGSLDRRSSIQRLDSITGAINADLKSLYSLTALPSSLTRRSTLPFPPSELLQIYGERELGRLALSAHDAFRADVLNRQVVHLTDVQAYLREEINSAYQLLSQPALENLWVSELATPQLVSLIRGHRHDELLLYRYQFMEYLPERVRTEPVGALAWSVFVESVLLNDKMNQEIQNSALVSNCQTGMNLDFLGPNPSLEAREIFASYVAARWPLKIFTIDPIANDQNIADTASIARQMQFAAAFAVASGEMNARAAINFSRNLQRDFATIDLNRTAVGFVHGDSTFGWRFEPRFQTPPVQNNAVVVLRDLICGGPTDNALRRQRRIEPGMRECVAMILTPSFVSGITIDTRSNWFCLNRPGLSATSMQELTEQSRSIVAMRRAAEQCVRRPDLYRDGEVERMLRRVAQLESELPLQTLYCQLPNSNTLGGFELFSSGTRELAPELLGWYGSPGYQPAVDEQVLFLVGDNFSVHQTKVIAGTKELKCQLLSRQIMQVTLPKDIPVVYDDRLQEYSNEEFSGYIDAHVATPYGVSGHMLIPALKTKSQVPSPNVTMELVLEGAAVEVVMNIKRKDGQFTAVGDLVVSRAPVALLNIPATIDTATAGLTAGSVDLVMAPSRGSDRLEEVVIKNVPVSNGKVTIGTPELIQAMDTKGALYSSLAPYGLWLANSAINFNDSASNGVLTSGIQLQVAVAIRAGDAGPKISAGTIPFQMIFRER